MFDPKRSGSSAEFEIALDSGAKGGQGRDEMGVPPPVAVEERGGPQPVLGHDASRRNRRSRDANSERVQLSLWKSESVLPLSSRGIEPAPWETPAAKRKESEFSYFFTSQPVEKSRIGRIKPRGSKQFCLDRLGSIRRPSRNRGPRVGSPVREPPLTPGNRYVGGRRRHLLEGASSGVLVRAPAQQLRAMPEAIARHMVKPDLDD